MPLRFDDADDRLREAVEVVLFLADGLAFPDVDRVEEVEALLLEDDAPAFDPDFARDAVPLLADVDFAFDPLDPDLELPVDLVAVDFFVDEAEDLDPPDLAADDFEEPDFELEDFLVVAIIFLRLNE